VAAAGHGCPIEFRDRDWRFFVVMAGPVPAIHVYICRAKDVDGRHEGGHDDVEWPTSNAPVAVAKYYRIAVGPAGSCRMGA
jgi:hypothetical protein